MDTDAALAEVCAAIAAGTGPVAIDAERASGYRYSARAYLIQLRREGAGTALVDPIAFDSLAPLQEVLDGTEWILHAATQDLPCMTELGLYPTRLFDTELAGRLLGYPRVGLASLVETLLGWRMKKEHSAVDWSTRPLPAPWLEYAALDVEVLVELRDVLAQELVEAGKDFWAAEEFDWLRGFTQPTRVDQWRRTSGLHKVRGRRALGAVRALWTTRDQIATERDVTPTPDHPRLRDHRGRAGDADHARGPEGHQGLLRARRRPLRRPLGGRARPGPRPAGEPAADADAAGGRSRRRRGPGPTRTPSPPGGSSSPARRSRRWPRSRTCPRRTC